MSLRKWKDSDGFGRGAKGIDDEKGVGFVSGQRDLAAEQFMYGRAWKFDKRPADSEHSSKSDTKKWSESPDYDTK